MKKARSDQARLARAFAVPPTKSRFVVLSSIGAAVIGAATPIGLVVAGGLMAGLGGFAINDRRAVRRNLREVERWGYPVVGYREWLLADEPTFEIELARDVETEVVVTSARAIDESLKVSRSRERTFRIISRRIALPPRKRETGEVLVGDRDLLQRLHEQLLAPLHADVGIRRMQMGDLGKWTALPALPAGDTNEQTGETRDEPYSMGAFRDSAMAAPPALQALVHVGGDLALPQEARSLTKRVERVVFATGSAPHGAGTLAAFAAGGAMTGMNLGPIGAGIGAIIGAGIGVVAAVQGNRRNARRIAASVDGHGFPIEGYDDWLISGRPLLDIELRNTIDRQTLLNVLATLPRPYSLSANSEVSWIVGVTWLDDKLVRLETRATLVEPPGRMEPFYGGSHQMFETFRAQVLMPLHAHAGIVAVRMGGYVTRRV